VRVHAAAVNPVDWKTRAGGGVAGVLGDPPWVLGWDLAGTVEALGPGVTRFEVGDEVYGMPRFPHAAGAYADYATAPSRQLAHKPEELSDIDAAAVPLAGLTAWQSLIETADVQPGQRVLIHAAAGGVGHVAVQLAHWRGAHVIATASTARHDWLRSLGADETINYRRERFENVVHDVDVVLDLVGGDYSARSLTSLRPGGLLLVIPSAADLPDQDAQAAAGVRARNLLVEPDGHALNALSRLIGQGALTPLVSQCAPLEQAAGLHSTGELGRNVGKTVLSVTPAAGNEPAVRARRRARRSRRGCCRPGAGRRWPAARVAR